MARSCRSLLKEVSVDEMLAMRASGMSNKEIADALGCGYSTLVKYIGPQPTISLRGEYGEYEVSTKAMTVRFAVGDSVVEVPFDKWGTFAKEVAAINCNLARASLSPEIW